MNLDILNYLKKNLTRTHKTIIKQFVIRLSAAISSSKIFFSRAQVVESYKFNDMASLIINSNQFQFTPIENGNL